MRLKSIVLLVLFSLVTASADAALSPEVKKELTELSRELRSVTAMLRKDEVDEAKAVIEKVEARLTELNIAEDERDRTLQLLQATLQKAKLAIPVGFEAEVAPIIRAKCLRCHSESQQDANLRLDTYANMGRGGRSGPLLLPRNPQRSLIMARIMAEGQARMPRGGPKLSDDEISIIGRWIAGGAEFDGEDVQAGIGESLMEKKPPKPKIEVVMADGSETVSFRNDVAPMLVNVCMGCHGGNNPRGGFRMTTFEDLLAGGDTGNTIVPGKPDDSYIVDLVLRQDPLKMPAGNQVRIKRSQAVALEKWIKEGAHFDGTDPKATLRSIVPTEAQLEAARLAAMSEKELSDRRIEQAETLWKRVAPREDAMASETENLYVYGNAAKDRMDQIAAWGESQIADLKTKYKLPEGAKPWRGRLIVFISRTRFDYEEFNTVLMNRRTPPGVSGHVVVTPSFETAYACLYDVGDVDSADSLTARQLLNSLIAQAYLIREGTDVPDWLQQGFGLMHSSTGEDSQYLKLLPQKAGESLSTITNPTTLFADGTFSPEEVGPVGYLLTRFLISNGGAVKVGQFVKALQANNNAVQAIQSVYGQTAADLGRIFMSRGGR